MVMTEPEVISTTKQLVEARDKEKSRLTTIYNYLHDGDGLKIPGLPAEIPPDVRKLTTVSRVNLLKFIVNSRVQGLYGDGIRTATGVSDEQVWTTWQDNGMDKRQIGIHRAALAYGSSYATVLPGKVRGKDASAVVRGFSPRNMTALYDYDDDEWPVWALECRSGDSFRVLDKEAVYWVGKEEGGEYRLTRTNLHPLGLTPVVRYRETDDLDCGATGLVWPHRMLQDQINITTFGLLVAQHYGAFRQRYILGWMAENEAQRFKASASTLWTFEDGPSEMQVGQFEQTDLSGYLDSREATIRHLATVSQTPAHELLGQLVNLSAEALAAASDSKRAATDENKTCLGESHEQLLWAAGELTNQPLPSDAWLRWRDTEPRSMATTADALGKMATMLGVPVEELWELIPGVSQQQIKRWKAAFEAQGGLEALMSSVNEGAPSGDPSTADTPIPA